MDVWRKIAIDQLTVFKQLLCNRRRLVSVDDKPEPDVDLGPYEGIACPFRAFARIEMIAGCIRAREQLDLSNSNLCRCFVHLRVIALLAHEKWLAITDAGRALSDVSFLQRVLMQ